MDMRHLSGQYNLKENDYTNHSENTIVISDGNQITEYMSSTVNELFSKGMDCVRTVIVYDK